MMLLSTLLGEDLLGDFQCKSVQSTSSASFQNFLEKKWKIFMWIYTYVLEHKILPRRKGSVVLFEQLL